MFRNSQTQIKNGSPGLVTNAAHYSNLISHQAEH